MGAHRNIMTALEMLDYTSLMRDARPIGGTTILATRALNLDARLYVVLHFEAGNTREASVLIQSQSIREALRKFHEATV